MKRNEKWLVVNLFVVITLLAIVLPSYASSSIEVPSLAKLSSDGDEYIDIEFFNNDSMIIGLDYYGKFTIWSSENLSVLYEFEVNSSSAMYRRFKVNDSKNEIIYMDGSGLLASIDVFSGQIRKELHQFDIYEGYANDDYFTFDIDAEDEVAYIAIGNKPRYYADDTESMLYYYDLNKEKITYERTYSGSIKDLYVSQKSEEIWIILHDGSLNVLDSTKGKSLRSYKIDMSSWNYDPTTLEIDENSNDILHANGDGFTKWSYNQEDVNKVYSDDTYSSSNGYSVEVGSYDIFKASENFIVSLDNHGGLVVYNKSSGEELGRANGDVSSDFLDISVSSNEKMIAINNEVFDISGFETRKPVSIEVDDVIVIHENESVALNAYVNYDDGSTVKIANDELVVNTSNFMIATTGNNAIRGAVVSGVREGNVILTITYENLSKEIDVYVRQSGKPLFEIITDTDGILLKSGEQYQLDFSVSPELPIKLHYDVLNGDIIELDRSGLIKAIKPGETRILVHDEKYQSLCVFNILVVGSEEIVYDTNNAESAYNDFGYLRFGTDMTNEALLSYIENLLTNINDFKKGYVVDSNFNYIKVLDEASYQADN